MMMIYVVCACPIGHAQINLVRNPSFERYSHCPHYYDQIAFANFWNSLDTTWNPLDSTEPVVAGLCAPEYCNKCDSTFYQASVPINYNFHHEARTGNGLAQVVFLVLDWPPGAFGQPYEEQNYLQGNLYGHLIAGHTYCVTFYICMDLASNWAIGQFGAYFDDGTIDTASACYAQKQYTPQVVHPGVVMDSVNWTRILGSFTANGTETKITIGDFTDSAHSSPVLMTPLAYTPINAAYILDDVSVIDMESVADAGPDRVTSPMGDSVWVGDTTADYLPCYWYINGVLADSNISGFKVLPDSTTTYVMVLDVCGNVTYDTAVVWVYPTSLTGLSLGHVLLYPNPASTSVTLEGARGCALTLVDAVGQAVWSLREAGMKETIPLTGLAPGVYTLVAMNSVTGERVVRMVEKR